jgi:hypothetical protein
MKSIQLLTAAALAASVSLGGGCLRIEFSDLGGELQMLGFVTSGAVSRQIESWDDFAELDHTSVALVVATVDGLPPEAWDPDSEWPGAMKWVLLRPQQPGESSDDPDRYNTGDFIADVPWRIDASVETQITLRNPKDAATAMLDLIDSSEVEYVWIVPGFGPFLMEDGDALRVRIDLPIERSEEQTPQEASVYDTVMMQHAYSQFLWINLLTLGLPSSEGFQENLEPVRENSYVFRVTPTR